MKHCALFLILLFAESAVAHGLNDSYLNLSLRDDEFTGVLQLAITDLELAVGIDTDRDTRITWGELKQASAAIETYVRPRLQMRMGEVVCTYHLGDYHVVERAGSRYLGIPLAGSCPGGNALTIDYRMLFDIDSSHRGIASIAWDEIGSTHVFAPDRRTLVIESGTMPWLQSLQDFITEGIWHIWQGIDHVLFLLTLLLGAVRYGYDVPTRGRKVWQATGLEVAKLVTAFTVAHSCTLVLSTLGIVTVRAEWAEVAIALSVVAGAVNLIVPLFRGHHWQFAFGFGLVHGFGFANVLRELNLSGTQFLSGLVGFNLGVEIGQLILVLALLPVLIILAHWRSRWATQTLLSA